jgi:FAD:protein FMN transferase
VPEEPAVFGGRASPLPPPQALSTRVKAIGTPQRYRAWNTKLASLGPAQLGLDRLDDNDFHWYLQCYLEHAVSSADDNLVTIRRTTVGLGTFISMEAMAPASSARRALDDACGIFEAVELAMHPTQPQSDLAAIARAPAEASVAVSAMTFEVLNLAQRLWQASGGLFDPCLPEQPGRFSDLELIGPGHVRRRGRVLALDLGGIAKGFAIDWAVDALRAAGCVGGLVNAGGDLRVFGEGRHTIQIRVAGAELSEVILENEALAVSAPKSSRSPGQHRGFYSPLNGQQVLAGPTAVRAPLASVADALTKCAIVCSSDVLQRLLREHGAHLVSIPSVARRLGPGRGAAPPAGGS